MLVPAVPARVEQAAEFARVGVDPAQVRSLMRVAVSTRQGEVVLRSRPAVLSCRDVLDLVGSCLVFLRNPAVLAPPGRPPPNQFAQRVIHRKRFRRPPASGPTGRAI